MNENESSSFFTVMLSFQGKTLPLENLTLSITASELFQRTRELLFPDDNDDDDVVLKILYKGKQVQQHQQDNSAINNIPVFSVLPKKTAKLVVMASHKKMVETLNSKRSDPLLRGFDNERKIPTANSTTASNNNSPWHGISQQHKDYKFVRFQVCTEQSFGHRASSDSAPHAFQAQALLEKLANDPGIVAIMKGRELVCNTLGEMDPIDDRIMQKKQQQHGDNSCLLGYNTSRGLRIHVRLRTLDLKSFLPYPQLAATLIHELSHNWVGEHDLLFWTNFGQMRVEYLQTHALLAKRGILIRGQTTAQLAGLASAQLINVFQTVMDELQGEMAQHGLPAQMIAPAIQQCCRELMQEQEQQEMATSMQGGGGGQRLLGMTATTTSSSTTSSSSSSSNHLHHGRTTTARELALAAAENRRGQQGQQQQQDSSCVGGNQNHEDDNKNKTHQQKKDEGF